MTTGSEGSGWTHAWVGNVGIFLAFWGGKYKVTRLGVQFLLSAVQAELKNNKPTLIKKKIKFYSYIRKFIRERLQSHIWLSASSKMTKYLRISSYTVLESHSSFMTCNHSRLNFPYIWDIFKFFFISVSYKRLKTACSRRVYYMAFLLKTSRNWFWSLPLSFRIESTNWRNLYTHIPFVGISSNQRHN